MYRKLNRRKPMEEEMRDTLTQHRLEFGPGFTRIRVPAENLEIGFSRVRLPAEILDPGIESYLDSLSEGAD
jgi:hypothetical protein